MGLRKMLALLGIGLVLVVGLGLYVVLVEMRPPAADDAAAVSGLVFAIKDEAGRGIPERATRLEIRRGGQTVAIEKAGEQTWRLKQPLDARAARSSVLAILTDIANLRVESVVPGNDLARFGLDEPRLRAAFCLGDERHDLAIGDEVRGAKAQEKKAYLRVGDRREVYVVDGALAAKLDRPPDAFRDRHVFERTRGPEKAKTLRIITAERKLVLEKEKDGWRLTSPVADVADAASVRTLLLRAATLQVADFVTDDASKLAEHGLAEPSVTCELVADDGSAMTLLVGKQNGGKLYAKRGEEPAIFTIEKADVAAIAVEPKQVRLRKVVELVGQEITSIEIVKGNGKWAVARDAADKPWTLVEPKQAKASQEAAAAFIQAIGRLRVARWIDDPWATAHEFLRKPEATVILSRGTKPPVKLAVSRAIKTKKLDGRFFQHEGRKCLLYVSSKPSDAVSSLEARESVRGAVALTASLDAGYLDFLDRKVFHFDGNHVTKLEIEREDTILVCEKAGDRWKLTLPVEREADRMKVATILGAMANLQAARYVAEEPKELMQYGLLDPALSLTVTIAEPGKPERRKTLHVSAPAGAKAHAMEEGGKLVFTILSWDIRALSTDLRAKEKQP